MSPTAHLNGSEKTESKVLSITPPSRWKLVQYTALSAGVYEDQHGTREVRYTLNVQDIASRRMIPTLIAVGSNPCPHRSCHLAQALALWAESELVDGGQLERDDSHEAVATTQLPML